MKHKFTVAIFLAGVVAAPIFGQTSGGRATETMVGSSQYHEELFSSTSYGSRVSGAWLGDLIGAGSNTAATPVVHDLVMTTGTGAAAALTSSGPAGLVLYDNFRTHRIDPSKWVGEPNSEPGGSDKDRREAVIEVVGEEHGRRLRIATTIYSDTSDNNGAGGNGFGLGFANPSHLKAVSFSLAVNKAQTVGCAGANPDNPTSATAGFFGDYFNPGPPQNGQTGDIVAGISVSNYSTNSITAFDVGAAISQCQDAKCDGQTTLSFQDLGPVEPGSTNTFSAAWDQANHQFIFRLNDNSPVSLTYNMPDSFPPGVADKSFFAFGLVPHCTNAPRPYALLDTTFGDVYVNK
jgi:hypothetical protein